jgi:DNA-binding CsgD family transcriptional regulator
MSPQSLLEREEELESLRGALREVGDGRGRTVIVRGPPGIGKSTIVALGAELAREAGMLVGTARGAELERSFPFGVVRQLAGSLFLTTTAAEREHWFDGAARLAAPLFRLDALHADDDSPTAARLHGLYWLCANVARERPLAIVVDDAQWSDDASLAALGYLVRRVAELPLLLLVATRPPGAETSSALAELLADPTSVPLAPEPLSADAVAGWLRDALATDPDPAFAAACREATGGNPFLLGELVREVAGEGIEPLPEHADRVRSIGPAGVRTVALLRLSRLPESAPRLARSLAVLGDGAALGAAAKLAGVDEPEAQRAAAALEAAGIVERRDALGFVHPILRTAIYEDIPSVERAAAHAAAATVLHDRGAESEAVAAHLLIAEPGGAPWVAATLQAAGRDALAIGDPDAATAFLRRALEEPGDHPAVLIDLGTAESRAGRDTAAACFERAAELAPDPETRASAIRKLAGNLVFAGDGAGAARVLEEGIAALDGHRGLSELLEAELIGTAYTSLALREKLAPRLAALRAPDGIPQTPFELFAAGALAYDVTVDGRDPDRGADLARRALQSPALTTDVVTGAQALVLAVIALIAAEELDDAERVVSAALEDVRAQSSRLATAAAYGGRALIRWRRGNPAGAEADAFAAMDLPEDVLGRRTQQQNAVAAAVGAGLDLGRPPAELEALLERNVFNPDHPTYVNSLIPWGRVLMAQGRHAEALKRFREAGEQRTWYARDAPSMVPWRAMAAVALAQLGEGDEARRLAAEEVELSREFGRPRTLGISLRMHGLVAEGADRRALLEEAVEVLEQGPSPLELARALIDLGAERRRGGDRSAARELLQRGYDLASAAWAVREAERAAAEIRSSGARLRPAQAGGAQALTPAERRVAELAADGLSNREIAQSLFLSEKTVETHLGSSYRKLGIRSRRKLPDALATSQPPDR